MSPSFAPSDVDEGPPGPYYSVVVPFFNESETAAQLLTEIRETLERVCPADAAAAQPAPRRYEVILVDDGSTDGTDEVLTRGCADWRGWRVLHFPENRGQAAALWAGMHAARGAVVILLDGDGQNDPADIPALLARLTPEIDFIVGVRASRRDSWARRKMSRFANSVRGWLLRDGVRDSGCGLKILRREVIGAFIPIRTLYSFMPALAVAGGFRVAEAPVNHRPRRGGKSSYGLRAFFWRPALDMLGVCWFTRRRCRIDRR